MKRLCMLMLMLPVAGCVTATPNGADAICTASRQARASHAATLAETPDDRAAVTGANLIEIIDAACR
jgi:hypothetical protein